MIGRRIAAVMAALLLTGLTAGCVSTQTYDALDNDYNQLS